MSFYRWCMRYGAAILFVIAILTLVFNLVQVFQLVSQAGSGGASYEVGVSDRPAQLLLIMQALVAALGGAAWAFFGALVINRLDRWLGQREQAEPFE